MNFLFFQIPTSGETISAAGSYVQKFMDMAIQFAPKILLAFATIIIGSWIIRILVKALHKGMNLRGLDKSLQLFLESLVSIGLRVIVYIMAASVLGFETTSLVAILGAASLAVGLALQGSLANFAGGVLVLIFRPFKVGDLIKAQGEIGVVKEIQIFNTIILTGDNRTVILPNGLVSNGVITNMTREVMRVDIDIQTAYSADISKLKSSLLAFFASQEKVLKTPAPSVEILKFNDSTITITIRPYSTSGDYWDVYFATTTELKRLMDEKTITLPQPSIVVKQG